MCKRKYRLDFSLRLCGSYGGRQAFPSCIGKGYHIRMPHSMHTSINSKDPLENMYLSLVAICYTQTILYSLNNTQHGRRSHNFIFFLHPKLMTITQNYGIVTAH